MASTSVSSKRASALSCRASSALAASLSMTASTPSLLPSSRRMMGMPPPPAQDRKGTRLNSGHGRNPTRRSSDLLLHRQPADGGGLVCTEVPVDGIHIGQQQESIGIELSGQQRAGGVLVDDRLDPQAAAIVPADDGNAAATGADHHHPLLQQQSDDADIGEY